MENLEFSNYQEPVYRTAPSTPGLLKKFSIITTTLLEGRGGLLEGEGRVCEVRKITAIFYIQNFGFISQLTGNMALSLN